MDDERKPWDQLPEEPDKAYAAFLVYCHLGPGRSIDKAYEIATKRTGKEASGTWRYYSDSFHWVERAAAFDVATISEHGRDVVVNWVRTLAKLSDLAFEKISSGEIEIRNLGQLLEVINVLGNFVTPETVQAAREFTSGDFGQHQHDKEGAEEEL
jgi:hypothetical protein